MQKLDELKRIICNRVSGLAIAKLPNGDWEIGGVYITEVEYELAIDGSPVTIYSVNYPEYFNPEPDDVDLVEVGCFDSLDTAIPCAIQTCIQLAISGVNNHPEKSLVLSASRPIAMEPVHENRAAWLQAAVAEVSGYFNALGSPLAERIQITIASTSMGNQYRTLIGQCCDTSRSTGVKSFDIIVSPTVNDSFSALGTLIHELCHVAAGIAEGHKGQFEVLARGMMLEGPLNSTTVGEAFRSVMEPVIRKLGEYPRRNTEGRKKSLGKKIREWSPNRSMIYGRQDGSS